MSKTISLVVVLLIAWNNVSLAQDAFETLDIAIGSDLIISGNNILNHWAPSKRVSAEFRTPYYRGELEAGGRYFRFDEESFEDSGFRSMFLFFGWHYPISMNSRFSVVPGFRIGTNFLTQDNKRKYFGGSASDPFIFHKYETIFSYELMVRARWSATQNSSISSTVSYSRSPLQNPISLAYFSVGISRTFTMPSWLQTFVK